MAGLIKKGNTYYAIFYLNGKKVKRSTGVKAKLAGYTNRQLVNWARQQAEKLEAIANGEALVDKQIDALKACKHIVGFCYTQMTDVEQEKNGIYYYDRTSKFDTERLKKIFEKIPSIIENPQDLSGWKKK